MLHIASLPLVALLLAAFSSADRTQFDDAPLLVGPRRPITASPGDDVVLPCRLRPASDVAPLTLEWSMADLKPDPADPLSRVGYVHLRRGGREVPDMKLQQYVGRTQLLTDALKDGDVSLRIKRVTPADQGRYRCHVPKLPGQVKELVVELLVGGLLHLGAVISGALCVLLVLGWAVVCSLKRLRDNRLNQTTLRCCCNDT
ncbi:myelin-oligodendrocyte glycoprotein-like isoform 1-T1 [Spinachia spinachia]